MPGGVVASLVDGAARANAGACVQLRASRGKLGRPPQNARRGPVTAPCAASRASALFQRACLALAPLLRVMVLLLLLLPGRRMGLRTPQQVVKVEDWAGGRRPRTGARRG